jgi:hypothetical protein
MSLDSVLARVNQIQSLIAPAQPVAPAAASAPAADSSNAFASQLQSAMSTGAGTTPTAPGGALAKTSGSGAYAHLSGDLDASPEILQRLEALAARRGEQFDVTSGLRTIEEQQRLWDNRGNNPFPVARPGTSRHQSGRATDVTIGGRPIQDVIPAAELRAAGLVPLAGDAVHVELP